VTGSASPATALPSALEERAAIAAQLGDGQPVVFSDYDGTLTPIVAKPELAVLDNAMREALSALARECPVGIISGRALADVKALVDLDNLYFAGNHGLEVAGPSGSALVATRGEEYVAELVEVQHELADLLADISGVLVEDKRLSVSVHYRLVPPGDVDGVEQTVDAVLSRHTGLRKHVGKKVFEIRPAIEWHKGYVVNWLLELLDIAHVIPIYLGDDVTDEDAFRAVAHAGIAIYIGDAGNDSAARYALRNPDEVRQFLCWLADYLREADK